MKPVDLQLGLIDFFGVMLPGAGLTAYLHSTGIGHDLALVASLSGQSSEAVRWAAFLLIAYALGHLLFMVAAQLDRPYDCYRGWIWPDGERNAFRTADALKKERLGVVNGASSMNTFSWAKAVLLLGDPTAAAAVERYEADSKFFRSLTVLFLLLGLSIGYSHRLQGLALVALAFATFARFAERRYKSTEWAYRFAITLCAAEARNDGTRPAERKANADS